MSECQLTDAMIDAVFADLDKDNSGELSYDEILDHAFPRLKIDLTDEQIEKYQSGEDTVYTKAQFHEFIREKFSGNVMSDMITSFKKFDVNEKGYLDMDTMKNILTKGEKGLSEKEIEGLLKDMDINEDGQFNIIEMVNVMYATEPVEGEEEEA